MAHCSEIDKYSCSYGAPASMPSMAEMMKRRYCTADVASCARVIVSRAVGGEQVACDLAPNDSERAHSIIARNRAR